MIRPLRRVLALVVPALAATLSAQAQIGGQTVFTSLALPPTARLAALGGAVVSGPSNDPGMLYGNPALLNADSDGRLALSYGDYLADIRQSTAVYSRNTEKLGRWGFGLSYLNYGDFDQYDPAGNALGTFSVNDYHLTVANAHTRGPITLGWAARFAVAGIAGNHSTAVLADVGGLFKHPTQDFSVGLAVKNLGYQVKPFDGAEREPLPLDVQLGLTVKPEHMPLRFTITAHHLTDFDIVYLDTAQVNRNTLDGQQKTAKKSTGDKIARHFTVGGELLLGKGLNVRVSYNHLRRRELRLDNTSGGAGLAFGVLLKVSKYQFEYTRAYYHVSGATNYLTLARNIDELFTKKEK
ncbi:type IX secretion system protein PorQ [Hymenobacter busanensis]|uniref:Type IX secretion system protein PorQ n=1 Tax=Hymenobacter busanensis TaxID=2607656 RepID=A0A7L5A1A8_9BACT|nr:type IX secretion system protein PorQ [Hymenobacter busanensis]KAA9338315.1 type IX secretion system protein PorQ [Hymenobacter busanensis]QHJ09261.1 type IX secretion system protein PorQ [Hymenobacter busanensis]